MLISKNHKIKVTIVVLGIIVSVGAIFKTSTKGRLIVSQFKWNTYFDNKYNYWISYPQQWIVEKTPVEGFGGLAYLSGNTNGNWYKLEFGQNCCGYLDIKTGMQEDTSTLKENESLKDYVLRIRRGDDMYLVKPTDIEIVDEVVKVGRYEMYRTEIKRKLASIDTEGGSSSDAITYYFIHNNLPYAAHWYGSDLNNNIFFIESILATIRFKD